MVTIRDVGARAGVSASTVSNVLNDRGYVAESTRKRVLAAVQELGYSANVHAQQLVTQRSRTVAIKLPGSSGTSAGNLPNSSYFLSIVNGATEEANDLGYALFILPTNAAPERFRRFGIDGYIVVDPVEEDPFIWANVPTMAIGIKDTEAPVLGLVDNDHVAALEDALETFRRVGRTTTTIVIDAEPSPYVAEITEAYRAGIYQPYGNVLIATVENENETDLGNVLNNLKTRGVDSLYAASDDIAIKLLKGASARGYKIPADFALISAVDSEALTITTPMVSAMNLYPKRAGKAAMRALIARLESNKVPERNSLILCDYVHRESV